MKYEHVNQRSTSVSTFCHLYPQDCIVYSVLQASSHATCTYLQTRSSPSPCNPCICQAGSPTALWPSDGRVLAGDPYETQPTRGRCPSPQCTCHSLTVLGTPCHPWSLGLASPKHGRIVHVGVVHFEVLIRARNYGNWYK